MRKDVVILVFVFFCTGFQAMGQVKQLPVKSKAASATTLARGKEVYTNLCLACHQADGSGVPHLNPPLTPNEWVAGPKPRLIDLVLKGSQGAVEIEGDTWSNAMPAQAHLSDAQIADVLTYIRNSFGNKASAILPAEVKAQRGKIK